jgi:hypothetical protein
MFEVIRQFGEYVRQTASLAIAEFATDTSFWSQAEATELAKSVVNSKGSENERYAHSRSKNPSGSPR